ncbi:MAG: hypothetical protein NE328_07885 [Lentisphaeraceae bacterium]|nr:hypothetical protein [Lentisphaeraceae bacterium]
MRNERTVRKLLLTLALLMSATLLYGGYQVHKEADRKVDYEKSVRSKAAKVNATLCQEMGEADHSVNDSIRFLRACAEGL